MNKLVCITGLTGAGKSAASDYFVRNGYQYMRFGQVVLDEVKKRGLDPVESNERPIREEFRKKYGMGAMAVLNLPKIKNMLESGNVLGDGLYSFEEYKILKDNFEDRLVTIAIYAPPKLRYKRLAKRKLRSGDNNLRDRPATKEAAMSRDYAELENLNKGATIAMAEYTVLNTKKLEFLYSQLDAIISEIK